MFSDEGWKAQILCQLTEIVNESADGQGDLKAPHQKN